VTGNYGNEMGLPMMHPGTRPMGPMGPMVPGMLFPADPAQMQMNHQLNQFMQMQMQFMHIMTGGQGTGPGAPANGHPQHLRSSTTGNLPTLNIPGIGQDNSGRAMSLMDPNVAPWRNSTAGYAPSIAPSERSNIGLPGRYRPVSQAGGDGDRPSSMSGAFKGLNNPNVKAGSLLSASKSPADRRNVGNNDDEDDEEGWEAMKAKREKKKSVWKEKKINNEIKDMLGLVHESL